MKIFSIGHRCQLHRWCTLRCGNGPNGILRGLGETDSWKKQKSKISWHCPFNICEKSQVSEPGIEKDKTSSLLSRSCSKMNEENKRSSFPRRSSSRKIKIEVGRPRNSFSEVTFSCFPYFYRDSSTGFWSSVFLVSRNLLHVPAFLLWVKQIWNSQIYLSIHMSVKQFTRVKARRGDMNRCSLLHRCGANH